MLTCRELAKRLMLFRTQRWGLHKGCGSVCRWRLATAAPGSWAEVRVTRHQITAEARGAEAGEDNMTVNADINSILDACGNGGKPSG